MTWISYAQNFEDVMLMRALYDIEHGFYIDVGAQHPQIDSVSRAFYVRGWRGIHVEPVPEYARLLREDRPDETVLQAMLGVGQDQVRFFEIPDTGLSSADETIVRSHERLGFKVHEIMVEQSTLSAVFNLCDSKPIHWLKIDVEGNELSTLRGWLSHKARPWIVVVESTQPLSQIPSHAPWEPYLFCRGYSFAYFDGLNRFYLHRDHLVLASHFNHGPCIFDDFCLSGLASAPFCRRPDTTAAQI